MRETSSTSRVRKWPDRATVERALRAWAEEQRAHRPGLLRLGVFGSFARGAGWGVGSDLDLVAVVSLADQPFERRAAEWPLEKLPVDADLLVYTAAEFERLLESGTRFAGVLRDETTWI